MIDAGYADDEIPLWVARLTAGSVEQPVDTLSSDDDARSEELSSDVVCSGVLFPAIKPKQATNTIPR